jgi:hypothetical protein
MSSSCSFSAGCSSTTRKFPLYLMECPSALHLRDKFRICGRHLVLLKREMKKIKMSISPSHKNFKTRSQHQKVRIKKISRLGEMDIFNFLEIHNYS